ncbi:MAG TPA: hypothetical protein VF173_07025 [Thermoanaerobaculia bacterium]|nr:hypothetical protein [Thermoanaerobaculia bacterium]
MAKTRFETEKGIPVWVVVAALILLAIIVWAISSLHARGHKGDVDQKALLAPAEGYGAAESPNIWIWTPSTEAPATTTVWAPLRSV